MKKFFLLIPILAAVIGVGLVYRSCAGTVKIMPMGDSLTLENHYSDLNHPRPLGMRSAYRNYLWYKLKEAGYDVDFVGSQKAGQSITPPFDPDHESYAGWKSMQLAEHTYDWLVQSKPDIILLHAGMMDRHPFDAKGIEKILSEVDRYEKESGHPVTVIVAQVINRRTPVAFITHLNQNIKAVVQQRISLGDQVVLVDMERLKLEYVDPAHPTDKGYEKMAQVWYDALINLPVVACSKKVSK